MRPEPERTALVIFAREPRPGQVKTRLLERLSIRQVDALYKAFVLDVCGIARNARCDTRLIFYAGAPGRPFFLGRFRKDFTLRRQSGRTLGDRMASAFRFCFRRGFGRVVLIGTDCLTITARDIEKAFRNLENSDCVLGPSRDGGYYLIGLRAPVPELFRGMVWGTGEVLAKSLEKLRKEKKACALLGVKSDIDTGRDLERYQRQLPRGRTTSTGRLLFRMPLAF
ncbi:MAG: TIGR04282 family arsenosugar biosynthesis glycosyltransferase [Candidatus Omnitrophota bacterium]|nr:TIGR04282 family arsenosugar biosynthesis glycosyltransferase [Candidatus Omnitrophota bacterium]MDZ4241788.1 TIGR04282 family arsenosugar biosynthesis glycosyltransferase [Candidatus Omnitrophota bacterium]